MKSYYFAVFGFFSHHTSRYGETLVLKWIKAWVLVAFRVLWFEHVFPIIFLHFNLRTLCLRPEPLWSSSTTFSYHVTSHAHNYAKSGLNRLHQFKECGHSCFRFNNILFTVKLIKLNGEFWNDTFLRNNYTFLSRPSLPLNKKRYGLQNVHKLRKPRLIP